MLRHANRSRLVLSPSARGSRASSRHVLRGHIIDAPRGSLPQGPGSGSIRACPSCSPPSSRSPRRRRRFLGVARWTAAPAREPFRKPDASEGGARTRDEVLRPRREGRRSRAGPDRADLGARVARVLMGETPFPQATGDATGVAPPASREPQGASIWQVLGPRRRPRSRRSAPPSASVRCSPTLTAAATPRPSARSARPTTRRSPAGPGPASDPVASGRNHDPRQTGLAAAPAAGNRRRAEGATLPRHVLRSCPVLPGRVLVRRACGRALSWHEHTDQERHPRRRHLHRP